MKYQVMVANPQLLERPGGGAPVYAQRAEELLRKRFSQEQGFSFDEVAHVQVQDEEWAFTRVRHGRFICTVMFASPVGAPQQVKVDVATSAGFPKNLFFVAGGVGAVLALCLVVYTLFIEGKTDQLDVGVLLRVSALSFILGAAVVLIAGVVTSRVFAHASRDNPFGGPLRAQIGEDVRRIFNA